jgi:hypothetical protein
MAIVTVTDALRNQMRFALQLNTTTLDSDTIDLVFNQAEEDYGYTTAAQIKAQAHLLVIEALLFGSAKEVDYVQNQSQEKASQRFDHLYKLYPLWQQKLADANSAATGPALPRAALTGKKPTRREEYPNE